MKNLEGFGRQICSKMGCKHQSLPGLVRGNGLCPYHWAEYNWGTNWAKKCYPGFTLKKEILASILEKDV